MDQAQFDALATQGYNLIPLMVEVLADLDTPLSTYLKCAQGPFSYLFESVQGGEKWGRYSMIGLQCRERLEIRGQDIRLFRDNEVQESLTRADPLGFITEYSKRFKVPQLPGLPKFTGGLVGFFGYDTVRYVEPRLGSCPNRDDLQTPDIVLMLSTEMLVFDTLKGKIYILIHMDPSQAGAFQAGQQRLQQIKEQLRNTQLAIDDGHLGKPMAMDDFQSDFGEEAFKNAVEKCRQYIIDGDIMQVVISQRLQAHYDAPPLDLYRALRTTNPSPYMYFVDMGEYQIVGSSPEILVRLEDGEITVRPIAGTRHRGETPLEDKALEDELLADPKELAEHLMLIDLGRNDVGRVAKIGTVQLTAKMVIERYSHVMHIVSNVIGQVRDEFDAMDVLRATFPAGTVSGAAKVRAMEIIDEVEPVKRGIYSGAVGYLGWHGNMDTAIAIRTAVIKDGMLYVQAGAGVVYDSVPQSEWTETMNKGRAVMNAAVLASKGLDEQQHN